MDPALADHAGYLEALLAGYAHRPELHRHQQRAVGKYLELARAATTAGHYLAATGQMMELARAEWLDRYYGEAYLAHTMGDQRRREASVINFESALAATDHVDLSSRLIEGKGRARPLEAAAEQAQRSVTELVVTLLEWKTERDPMARDNLRADAHSWWCQLRDAEPGWSLETLRREAMYRRRIPFADDALGVIGGWLAELVGDDDARQASRGDADDLRRLDTASNAYFERVAALALGDETTPQAAGSALEAAAPYRAVAAVLPDTAPARPVYEAIVALADGAADANAFARALIERGLHLELARVGHLAQARTGRVRAEQRGQPWLQQHFELLETALLEARSITALEQDLFYLEHCLEVELAWNSVLLAYATRPLRAALGWEFDRSEEQRQSIVASYRAASETLGLDWHGLVNAPVIKDFIGRVLLEATHRPPADAPVDSANFGELGLALANDVRKATALAEITRAEALIDELGVEAAIAEARRSRFATAEDLIGHATALFEQALGGGQAYVTPGPASRRTLLFWDRPRRLDEPAVDLAARRPPVRLP